MGKSVVIYGVGAYGKRLYHFLKSINCTITFFCQTSCDANTYYDGVKIIDIEQLSTITGEVIVLISIGDSKVSKCVKGQLLNCNRSDMYIYELGDFISTNIPNKRERNTCYCNICGERVEGFEKSKFHFSEGFSKYHLIGGGARDNVNCPSCGSGDRVRWQYWVLGKHTEIFKDKCRVLHIAPEYGIKERIQDNILCDYYMGDIVCGIGTHIIDVTNIQFKDNFFDYIIMNHVLEHIEDEARAITELKRVLKPNGKLILSFPICTDIDTYENPDIQTPEERLAEYGQEDHVRLYGRDYKARLMKYGLNIEEHSPQNECSMEEISRYGFIYNDVILMCGC